MSGTKPLSIIEQIQYLQRKWAEHNFPDSKEWMPLLGAQEELGELSHAYLKYAQGIREKSREKFEEEAKDAIGDTVIYLMDFCNKMGWSFQDVVAETWEGVVKRDWKNHPNNGRDEGPTDHVIVD